MKILSQKDSRWKNTKINGTSSTIGNYGCTLTCLAMLADSSPDILASMLKFNVDKIIWSSINDTDLLIRFPDMGRYYIYDNEKVKEAIEKNGGCLVEVDFDGIINTKNDRHWILYVGGGMAYDPWTGTEISTSKYPIVKGFCIIDKIKENVTPVITYAQKRILEFLKGKTEGDVREAFGALNDLEDKNKQIQTLTNKVHELELQMVEVNTALAEIKSNFIEKDKEVLSWQKKYNTANTKLSEQILKNEELDRLAKDNKNLYLQKNDDYNNLNKIFEEYKKTHPDEIVKFNIINFIINSIKSLLKK